MSAPTTLTYGVGVVDESLTLAWTNLMPGILDNVFNDNTALGVLYKNFKKLKQGGVSLSHAIRYGASTSGGAYSRYEQMDVTPQDGLTRDQWNWKQYYWTVALDGFTERVAGKGEWATENALEEKKSEAEDALRNDLEGDIFKASPTSAEIRSLPVIVLASGTEGQINGGTSTWWQSNVVTAGSWAAGTGRQKLVNMLNTSEKRQPVGPLTHLVSDQTSVEAYENTIVSQYRYSNGTPDIGAMKLTFKEIPWVYSVQATSGVIYGLHPKALEFVVNKDTDFIFTGFVKPANQDAKIGQILLALSLQTGVRRKLGKTTANAA